MDFNEFKSHVEGACRDAEIKTVYGMFKVKVSKPREYRDQIKDVVSKSVEVKSKNKKGFTLEDTSDYVINEMIALELKNKTGDELTSSMERDYEEGKLT